jgi:prepilin-type N-terminal cleavage/methylation domain-containing protein
MHGERVEPMKFRLKQSNQRGDTIVEVLIALAIISSVLAGAFLVVQRSAYAVRDGQERGEMLQILQGQVELVRQLSLTATDTSSGVFSTAPSKFFCVDVDSASPTYRKRVDSAGMTAIPPIDSDDYASYNSACTNIQGLYNVAVTYTPSAGPANPAAFKFYGRWDRLGGGKNEEQLVYRIYPGTP